MAKGNLVGRVEGKVALITGGARGLGEATGRIMAKEGATVILTDLLDNEGEALAASINDEGGTAEYIHQDVTDEALWDTITSGIMPVILSRAEFEFRMVQSPVSVSSMRCW